MRAATPNSRIRTAATPTRCATPCCASSLPGRPCCPPPPRRPPPPKRRPSTSTPGPTPCRGPRPRTASSAGGSASLSTGTALGAHRGGGLACTRLRHTCRAPRHPAGQPRRPWRIRSTSRGHQTRQLPEGVRRSYDVIGFDPRGVGQSAPADCGAMGGVFRQPGRRPHTRRTGGRNAPTWRHCGHMLVRPSRSRATAPPSRRALAWPPRHCGATRGR